MEKLPPSVYPPSALLPTKHQVLTSQASLEIPLQFSPVNCGKQSTIRSQQFAVVVQWSLSNNVGRGPPCFCPCTTVGLCITQKSTFKTHLLLNVYNYTSGIRISKLIL